MVSQHSVRRVQMVLLLLCGAVRIASGQAHGDAGDAVFALHGTVVDGVTGKPVARALVMSSDQRLAGMTDGEGRFKFEVRVPEGAPAVASPSASGGGDIFGLDNGLVLLARKPGYLSQQSPTLIRLDGTLSTTDFVMKLMPSAVVAGRITADGDGAAAGVTVSLQQHVVTGDGRWSWAQVRTASSNGRGEYRFADLLPGDYAVESLEWRGEQPLQQQRNVDTEEYPPVFFGDTRTIAGATKLHVRYGDAERADLHLEMATYYPVTIPVEAQMAEGAVNATLMHAGPGGGQQLSYNAHERAMEGWLPNGHYSVLLFGMGQQPGTAVVELSVEGKAARTKPVTLVAGGHIQVRVHSQLTKPEPVNVEPEEAGPVDGTTRAEIQKELKRQMPLVTLELRSDDAGSVAFGRNGGAGNTDGFALESVQPGSYSAEPTAFRGYVSSLTSGGVDLLQQPLVVNASGRAAPIDVTLRDDGATAKGKVSWDKGPLPVRSTVFFVPADRNGQFNRAMAGATGTFSVENLVPGRYRVMAFPDARALLPYRDAESMRAYEAKGVEVTAEPNQTLQVEVPLLDQATPEGVSFDIEL